MARLYNFSAGPAALPESVLKRAAEEMLDYDGCGMSVMEMSHRSLQFNEIIDGAQHGLRELMHIPENYRILFLQGGASSQFAMVPLNLMKRSGKADYINSGYWSQKAIDEAKRYISVNVAASSENVKFNRIPGIPRSSLDPDAGYVHITTNNTIYGTAYHEIPETGGVPLVADMSSNIIGQYYDVKKFGIIYAGAQKNIGPAGLTVVIIRDDLVGFAGDITPAMFNYKKHVEKDSLYNTPPTFAIYIAKLVFEWLIERGGVAGIEQVNREKARLIYDCIDNSALYKSPVVAEDRSIMTIPFMLPTEGLNAKFVKEAGSIGLSGLKGHRAVGGMRASIYNAMPINGVKQLVDFMKKFERDNR